MLFCGKSMDGFEYAVNCFLRRNGVAPVRFADTLSLRNVCLVCGEHVADWFAPLPKWNEYMAEFEKNTGYCIQCISMSEAMQQKIYEDTDGWFLLGDLDIRRCEETVRSRFYHGAQGFLVCRKNTDEVYEVSDPVGCPSRFLTQMEMDTLMDGACGFFAKYEGKKKVSEKEASYKRISRKGLLWREKTSCEAGRIEKFDFTAHERMMTSEKISLKYALINYQNQMWKLMKFAEATFGKNVEIQQEITELLGKAYDITQTEMVAGIPGIDRRFWLLMEEWMR